MSLDKTLEKRRRAETPTQNTVFCVDGYTDAIAQEDGKPTQSTATPSQKVVFGTDEPRVTIAHDAGKATSSDAKPVVATTT
jgi:hypothetical protein